MHALRLGAFLLVSAALHGGLLLTARDSPRDRVWPAGLLSITLVQTATGDRHTEAGLNVAATSPKRLPTPHAVPATGNPEPPPRQRPLAGASSPRAATPREPPPATARANGQQQDERAGVRGADLERQLRDRLHQALLPHFSYPLLARRRGWEGIVRIGVRIEANGSLSHLHLVEPCPYEVLNNAAVQSLSRLTQLPDAATWLQGRPFDLVLPVEYRLLES